MKKTRTYPVAIDLRDAIDKAFVNESDPKPDQSSGDVKLGYIYLKCVKPFYLADKDKFIDMGTDLGRIGPVVIGEE